MSIQQTSTSPVDRRIRRTTTVSVLLLAAIAAVVSYRHMHELALAHGETRWTAALIPLSVDGMVVASSMSILLASRSGQRAEWLPWTLLAMGSLASLAANVAVAEPTLVGRLIAAWPSFAFVGAYEMLQDQLRAAHSHAHACDQTLDGIEEDQTPRDSPTNFDDISSHGRSARSPGKRLQFEAWEWALANRTPDGDLPPGRRIAERFDRRERWGRMVKHLGSAGAYASTDASGRTGVHGLQRHQRSRARVPTRSSAR